MVFTDSLKWELHRLDGGQCLLRYIGDPSPDLSRFLGSWSSRLRCLEEVRDAVPGYTELAITTVGDCDKNVSEWLEVADEIEEGDEKCHRVIVDYCGEDLEGLAAEKGMSLGEVIERHTKPIYTVAMVGFRPHFPYLLGLDPLLATQRRSTPRTRVEAGSVAIGGSQTGIYPEVSPGGWHILGKCDPSLCKIILPGHRLQFERL